MFPTVYTPSSPYLLAVGMSMHIHVTFLRLLEPF